MKKSFLFLTIFFFIFLFTGCASKEKPVRERDETYIADIDSFDLETVYLYTQRKTGKPKVNSVTFSFSPRTNYIFITTKIGIDFVRVGFSYEERKSLYNSYTMYINDFNEKSFSTEKPTKKNAYSKGYGLMYWGAAGLSYEANAPYFTNVYFMEPSKPYYRLYFSAGEAINSKSVYSPSFSIYISPTQWKQILDLCDQAKLEARVDDILAQANSFDDFTDNEFDEVEQVEEEYEEF